MGRKRRKKKRASRVFETRRRRDDGVYTPSKLFLSILFFWIFFFFFYSYHTGLDGWAFFLCVHEVSLSSYTQQHTKNVAVCVCALQALPERGCRSIKIICQWRLASGFIAPAHSSLSLPQASIDWSEQLSISTEKKEYTNTCRQQKQQRATRPRRL